MKDFSLALFWLGLFASVFFGWYFYLKARNKERMALIEKNADVSEIFKPMKLKFNFNFPWFKIGMMITGIGLGLVTAIILSTFIRVRNELVPSLMLLFGGLSMVIAYYLEKQKDK